MSKSKVFQKILAPLSNSRDILQQVALLAEKFTSDVIVTHIVSTGIGEFTGERNMEEGMLNQIRSYLNQESEEMIENALGLLRRKGIKASSHIIENIDPAENIIATARDENVDLIVMGHKEKNNNPPYTLGSTTRKVSRHADQSVLIVKELREPRKILVAFDSSDEAQKALNYAEEIAKKFNSIIKILHVTPRPKVSEPVSKAEVREKIKDLGKEIINRAKTEYSPQKIEKDVRIGNPADVILEVAEEEDFDLIAVGSRGLTTVKKYLLGSVSEKVSENSKRSVLVAK